MNESLTNELDILYNQWRNKEFGSSRISHLSHSFTLYMMITSLSPTNQQVDISVWNQIVINTTHVLAWHGASLRTGRARKIHHMPNMAVMVAPWNMFGWDSYLDLKVICTAHIHRKLTMSVQEMHTHAHNYLRAVIATFLLGVTLWPWIFQWDLT